MRFKVDENLPVEVAARLRMAGHDAPTVLDEKLGGKPDVRLADVCRNEKRALITLDLDFADIRTYPPEHYDGLIVLRPQRQDKPHLLHLFAAVVPLLETEPLAEHLWVVDEVGVRIRGAG